MSYCYRYCNQFCDWWILLSGLSKLAASTVRLQVSDYSQPSDYTVRLQLYRMISEK